MSGLDTDDSGWNVDSVVGPTAETRIEWRRKGPGLFAPRTPWGCGRKDPTPDLVTCPYGAHNFPFCSAASVQRMCRGGCGYMAKRLSQRGGAHFKELSDNGLLTCAHHDKETKLRI